MELNVIYNEDCLTGMQKIPGNSIDVVLTDPPYLYLKNQKLDRPFDEQMFFSECKRLLKKDGFIVIFGRGESFYRWNTILASLGFNFKEEIIWNKSYCSSPLMAISRVHETIAIWTNGKGSINKIKVPYLEMKRHDIASIITDIKRLKTTFNNPKSLVAVQNFLKNNERDVSDKWHANNLSISSEITKEDRCVSVARSMEEGMNEKTIIRTDRHDCDTFTKHGVNADKRKTGDRCANVMQSIEFGMNEKTIIQQPRDHYNTIHPTQKPVRLLERLLALVTKPGDVVLDPFSGSGSTAVACINTERNYVGFEIDEEFQVKSTERIANHKEELKSTQINTELSMSTNETFLITKK